ncbi:MAG: glucose-6-phosphate isomerase [Acidimicrobiales bacterium]
MATDLDPTGKERLGDLADEVDAALDDLITRHALERIWAGDHTLWQDDPTEVADRLGWLHVVTEMRIQQATLEGFASDAIASGFTHAVLVGMGGSSLFPEVIARTFQGGGPPAGGLLLTVLDTTDPAAVARAAETSPLDRTLFVAASKSGTTLETRSHLAFFWELVGRPEQFAVVTDPGSALARLAYERRFRAVFENREDVGGRYSALSYFGLVPAAVAGVDVAALLETATAMGVELADGDRPDADQRTNPGLRLGAIMGAAARVGRDKLTLIIDPEIESFGLWIEQLVAESTGKQGTGVVPVVGEPVGADPSVYGPDRLFVAIGTHPALDALAGVGHPVIELPYEGPTSLGALVLLWEFATAVCGALLGINPFDQPDVSAAKAATARVLDAGELPVVEVVPLAALLDQVRVGDYLAIQAYVDPGSDVVARIEDVRARLRDDLKIATTFGLGPRFLHSTGQLHKGGPPTGVFVQLVGDDRVDVPIAGQPYGFATLKQAQAIGDLETLRSRGLRAGRVALDEFLEVSA